MTEKKVTNKIKKLIKISQNIKKNSWLFLSTRVLSIPKNIDKITKNKW